MSSVQEPKSNRAVRKKTGNKGTRVAEVSSSLREQIVCGCFEPGDKLPTEAGLTRNFNVSRTVVREAIATLRAAGLVEVRHGVGVFVREPVAQPGTIKPVDRARISSMIEMLEVRASIEIEAAALAAERCTPVQEETLFRCFDALEQLNTAGKSTVAADLEFHLAVADATGNPRFREFLMLMGEHLIPRSTLPQNVRGATPDTYMNQIQSEHRAIIQTILERDVKGARSAMRVHVKGSQARYRYLIRMK